MKKIFLVAFALALFLNACSPATTQVVPSSSPPTETATATPTFTATATQIPATATITPLPTIPTFAPTFDARTIVTAMPAPKAECPKENPSLVPDFQIPIFPGCFDTDTCMFAGSASQILNFLNQGGSLISTIRRLRKAKWGNYRQYAYEDVTGDRVPDFIFLDFASIPKLHIFYCQNNKYNVFTFDPETYGFGVTTVKLESVVDLNSDNIPEIILLARGCSGSGCFAVSTFEWNGDTFKDLSPEAGMFGLSEFRIQDSGASGLKSLVLKGDRPGTCCADLMTPWRYMTIVYSWNGKTFGESYRTFDVPQYRYQAIQDADRETLYGNHDKAQSLYQGAIFSDKLDWWSADRRDIEVRKTFYGYTPEPYPTKDQTEYPKLAAYAYYRIMLLRIIQNHLSDAETVYKTLQQKFGNDQYGHPYIEMANAFWGTYQSTHRMYDGCAAAIEYAAETPSILDPLSGGSSQDHYYKPEDVCPFR